MKSRFLPDWVEAHARATPDAPAVDALAARLTYRTLAARVRQMAGALAFRGVTARDRVLIALPNSPATVVTSLAVQALGACSVECDRAMGVAALQSVAAETQARFAVIYGRDARTWAATGAVGALAWLWVVHGAPAGKSLNSALGRDGLTLLGEDGALPAEEPAPAPPEPPRREEDPALVVYTSGSTGRPRGVIHTFRNIDANSRSIVEYLGLSSRDRAMLVMPLHYTYGKSVLQTHLLAGGSVFLDNRFMFPRVVMEALGTERCTSFAGVPAAYELLRREVDLSTVPMPSLRYVTQAGGPMRPDTVQWARRAFAPARLYVMYGQTEATARLTYVPPERGEEKLGSIGIPIPGVELQVVDEGGGPVPDGVVGHLVARGDNVSPGYLNAPEETRAILRDGWLWTGDLARRDPDGFFFVVGRAKEILKIGGHRVSPVEIENTLLQHPQVVEAAVVGMADDVSGEAAAAFVVAGEAAVSDADLQRFCRDLLPAYKVPKRIEFVDRIPRTEAGKPLRAQLAERLRAPPLTGETRL